jgi:hypothetical protein
MPIAILRDAFMRGDWDQRFAYFSMLTRFQARK